MNIYLLVFAVLIISIVIFTTTVKILDFVPKRYYIKIELMQSISVIMILFGGFITYYNESLMDKERKNTEYIDKVINSFEKIDDFLINNYDEFSLILSILYQKNQLPSSDVDLNKKYENASTKVKDILFMIYNKLTYIFEKIYIIDKDQFDNDKLGVRIRIFIENIFYYEFWHNTKNLFGTGFVDFMTERYKYLNDNNNIYVKPNYNLNRIPYNNDNDFIFNSPKYNTKWK